VRIDIYNLRRVLGNHKVRLLAHPEKLSFCEAQLLPSLAAAQSELLVLV